MPHRPNPTRLLALAVRALFAGLPAAAFGVAPIVPAHAAEAVYAFDLPADELSTTLTRIADRAGVQLVANAELTAGKRAPAIEGTFTLDQALDRALAGSGLAATRSAGGLRLTRVAAGETALPAVMVTAAAARESAYGPVAGYLATRSASATKTDTPLAETPQSVTVVTRERIEDQGAQSTQDALNYAAGVRSDAFGLDSRTDSVLVRGGYPDTYQDGLRQLFNFYTSTTRVEPYTLERIEVLRGPSAMLFGQGTTAGIVNLVSKRPLAETQREIGVQVGSFSRKQVQADLSGPLTEDRRWLYRLVMLGRDADTQVDFVPDDRAVFAPSLTWQPDADTTLTLRALYQKDESGSTLQFFPWEGTVQPNPNGRIPTSRFIGEPGFDRYDSERKTFGWTLEHRFAPDWRFQQNFRLSNNEVDYRTLYADSFSNPGNSYIDPARRMLDRYPYVALVDADLAAVDQHVEGMFSTGAIEHRVIVGLDALRFKQNQTNAFDAPISQGGTAQPIDVFDPVYTGYTPPGFVVAPETRQRQLGIYAQDQLRFGRWNLVAGLRHDRATSATKGSADEKSRATTGRLGAIYRLDNGLAPYVSYSESFTPLAGTDFFGNRYDPLRGEQYELGVKFESADARQAVNLAAYDLREKNRLVNDPNNPLNQVQAGETRTRGFEAEWLGRIARRTNLSAHYNYIDNDDALDALPRHQAALWVKQGFSIAGIPGLSAGLGVRYFSAFTDKTAPETPELTLFDAALIWDTGPWRYALNVQNLEDEAYVSTCLPRGDCFYGARRTAILTANYRF